MRPIASFSNVIESVDAEKKDAAADEGRRGCRGARVCGGGGTDRRRGRGGPRARAQSSASRPPPRLAVRPFSQLGGNSFQAMQAVATFAIRRQRAYLRLLTRALAAFAASVVRLATARRRRHSGSSSLARRAAARSVHDRGRRRVRPRFFPAAGSASRRCIGLLSVRPFHARYCYSARRTVRLLLLLLGEWLDAACCCSAAAFAVGAACGPGRASSSLLMGRDRPSRCCSCDCASCGVCARDVVVSVLLPSMRARTAASARTATHRSANLRKRIDLRAFLAASGIDNDIEGAVVVDELLAPSTRRLRAVRGVRPPRRSAAAALPPRRPPAAPTTPPYILCCSAGSTSSWANEVKISRWRALLTYAYDAACARRPPRQPRAAGHTVDACRDFQAGRHARRNGSTTRSMRSGPQALPRVAAPRLRPPSRCRSVPPTAPPSRGWRASG